MTEEFLNRVYDVLVNVGEAHPDLRFSFVSNHLPPDTCYEWRFIGSLGFGGKYRSRTNTVDCYREDETPERLATIAKVNADLAALKP